MTDVDRERRAQAAKAAIRSYQEWLRANRNAITTHVLNERLVTTPPPKEGRLLRIGYRCPLAQGQVYLVRH